MKKILFSFCIVINCYPLILHEYYLDLFKYEPLATEFTAYKLLKKKPIEKNINYLAIPWSVLINRNELNKIPDIKLNGGFTICQHIKYEKIIPILKKIGIDTLFTPHVYKRYTDITVLPFPHLAVNGITPAKNKDIFYSFIGLKSSHWTRKEIFSMKHPKNSCIIERKDWHFWINKKNSEELKSRQEREKNEYQSILSRSIFSLCPRGTGASTIRFWESLQAGSIPVLISDDMQLPKEYDWQNCIIKISENNVKKIPEILSKIPKKRYKLMMLNCLEAYELFSEKNFIKTINDYYA